MSRVAFFSGAVDSGDEALPAPHVVRFSMLLDHRAVWDLVICIGL